MSDSLWHHELQHFRFPCPSPPSWVCSNSCSLIYQLKSRQRKPTNTCKNSQLTRRPMVLNSGLSTCWISYSWEIIFLFYLIYQMSFFCSNLCYTSFLVSLPDISMVIRDLTFFCLLQKLISSFFPSQTRAQLLLIPYLLLKS